MISRGHPCPAADLWILAGQSNMAGRGWFAEAPPAHPRIFSFDSLYEWRPARPPLHHIYAAHDPVHRIIELERKRFTAEDFDRLGRGGRASTENWAGPGFFFARRVLGSLPADQTLALLPCAHGGSFLDEWEPDRPGRPGETLYSAMMKRLAASGLRPKGMLWYQGESDGAPGLGETYEARFLRFIERLRADLARPDLPVFTVQISRVSRWESVEGWDQVREAQRRVALRCPHLYMTNAIDCEMCDRIHLAYSAQQRLGERLARLALTHVYGVPTCGPTIQPDHEPRISHGPKFTRLHLRFNGAQGALRSAGRPAGFTVLGDPPPAIPYDLFDVALNADGPGTAVVSCGPAREDGLRRVGVGYGRGLNPYCNITDEADMPLPAFAPLWIDVAETA